MSDAAIQVQGLWKQYRIGKRERYKTFRESVVQTALAPLRKIKRAVSNDETSTFWALHDLNFEINRGEVVGIIGRNGAGKSTLLKILSRITEPTKGRIEINGRVGSLLEVGTGFHPELTGRENIYLNGAILGMTRGEITRKFDAIVAFSEIEKFLDTAVKYYSSGMYMRLAFAVAAHLEPEIIIVDEVLAVGDMAFQKKCLGKMGEVAKQGRTVLFVSHNLHAIRQLCTRGILLQSGELIQDGSVNEVANHYLDSGITGSVGKHVLEKTGFVDVDIVDADGNSLSAIGPEQKAYVSVRLRVEKGSGITAGFTIYNQADVPLMLSTAAQSGVTLAAGESTFRVRLPSEILQPGTYRIEGAVWDAIEVYHQDDNLCHFHVTAAAGHDIYGRGSAAHFVLREPWVPVSR